MFVFVEFVCPGFEWGQAEPFDGSGQEDQGDDEQVKGGRVSENNPGQAQPMPPLYQ